MTESGNVSVSVHPSLKQEAEKVLARLGLTPQEAIAEFYREIAAKFDSEGDAWLELPFVSYCLCWGKTPNAETIAAMKETAESGGLQFDNFEHWLAFHRAEEARAKEDAEEGS